MSTQVNNPPVGFSEADKTAIISESVTLSEKMIDEKAAKTNRLMQAVVLVLFIGFISVLLTAIGLVLDAWRFKSNSYEGFIETMRAQEKIMSVQGVQNVEIQKELETIRNEMQALGKKIK